MTLPRPWSRACSLQNCETTDFCCLSYSVCGTLLWQPLQTHALPHCASSQIKENLKMTVGQAIISQSGVPREDFGLCPTSKWDPRKGSKEVNIRFMKCKRTCRQVEPLSSLKVPLCQNSCFLLHKKYSHSHQKNSCPLPNKNASRRHLHFHVTST